MLAFSHHTSSASNYKCEISQFLHSALLKSDKYSWNVVLDVFLCFNKADIIDNSFFTYV